MHAAHPRRASCTAPACISAQPWRAYLHSLQSHFGPILPRISPEPPHAIALRGFGPSACKSAQPGLRLRRSKSGDPRMVEAGILNGPKSVSVGTVPFQGPEWPRKCLSWNRPFFKALNGPESVSVGTVPWIYINHLNPCLLARPNRMACHLHGPGVHICTAPACISAQPRRAYLHSPPNII